MQRESTPTSIRSTVHLLAAEGSMPQIAAHVERIMGSPTVFVTMSTDYRTSSYTTGTAVSFSGTPEAVKDLLTRCLAALEEITDIEGEAR
jgi:hypothetical protein